MYERRTEKTKLRRRRRKITGFDQKREKEREREWLVVVERGLTWL